MVCYRFGFWKGFVAAFLTIAVVGSGVAYATADFDDVPDTAFYADATTWAKANGITTGSPAGSKTFKPNDPVTRGESVTFLKRYDDNVVQPALDALPTQYFAHVQSDGVLRASSSDGVTVTHPGAGQFEVEFPPDDIRECTFSATLVGEPFGLIFAGPAAPDARISLAEDWDFGGAFFVPDTDSLFVSIRDASDTPADASFHLTVTC